MTDDTLPPHDPAAEQAVLGSIIVAGGAPHQLGIPASQAIHILSGPESFFMPQHGLIYKALVELFDANVGMDTVTLKAKLQGQGIYEQIGGTDYLVEICESVPTAINAPHFAKIVENMARRRRMQAAGEQVAREADHLADPDDLAELAMGAMSDACATSRKDTHKTRAELITSFADDLEADKVDPGLSWGYDLIDEMGTLKPGEMTVLGARPSMGKTSLAENIGERVAASGHNVWAASLEQTHDVYRTRAMARLTGIDSRILQSRRLNDIPGGAAAVRHAKEQARIAEEYGTFHIEDLDRAGIHELRNLMRMYVRQHDVKLVIIDYLQLVKHPDPRKKRYEQLGEICHDLLIEAKRLNIHILALSQLSRSEKGKNVRLPELQDLRESGNIEEYATNVWLLHRGIYYTKRTNAEYDPSVPYVADLIIAKQKNGPTGTVKLTFQETTTIFAEGRDAAFSGSNKPQPAGGTDDRLTDTRNPNDQQPKLW